MNATLRKIVTAYAEAMKSRDGAVMLSDLVKRFAQRGSFVPDDPHATSYREGQRSVVLSIQRYMTFASLPTKDDTDVPAVEIEPDEGEH